VAGDRHDARHRLDLAVISGAQPLRSGLAEGADAAIDQARIDLRQRLVADTELVHHAGAKILHHHVGFRRKALDDLDRFRLLQVQRQAALAAVDRLPSRRKPALGPLLVERGAAHVLALAPLHLDDIGAEQAQLVAGVRPGEHLREVENSHAFERSGHATSLFIVLRLFR
jgi:hypothetical protein